MEIFYTLKLENLNKNVSLLYTGKSKNFTPKILPENWEILFVTHSGDNDFSNYAFTSTIPRVSLEKSKLLTIYEMWGGDDTDWFNLTYNRYSRELTIKNKQSSDNDVIISIL